MNYPKRLIEVDLPIARISAHARREKSIRHGHISTLHIWWARRPLAACRAVICASLWPDPADPLCPPVFRAVAEMALNAFAVRVFPPRLTEEGHQLQETLSPESRARWEEMAKDENERFPNKETAQQYAESDSFVLTAVMLREALLDFIADFASCDNSTAPAYLETSRTLTQAAHETLGGAPGTRPLVVDPFAGGGSIPLEALRIGADAFASDLNPIPVLLNKVVLEYIPKFGQRLAEEVRKWGEWIKKEAVKELEQFYPKRWLAPEELLNKPLMAIDASNGSFGCVTTFDIQRLLDANPGKSYTHFVEISKDQVHAPTAMQTAWGGITTKTEVKLKKLGAKPLKLNEERPIAYLWARKIVCEGPACGAEVPLIRSLWLTKKGSRAAAFRLVPKPAEKRVDFEIINDPNNKDVGAGTVRRGSATCPCCGFTTPVASVRIQLKSRKGGSHDAKLLAIVTTRDDQQGRFYRLPDEIDKKAVQCSVAELEKRKAEWQGKLSLVPEELTPRGGGSGAGRAFSQRHYGMEQFCDLFTPRQLLLLTTLGRWVRTAGEAIAKEHETGMADAVQSVLACAVDRAAEHSSTLCRWNSSGPKMQASFGRQAISMMWDFCEADPFGGSVGSWDSLMECVLIPFETCVHIDHTGSAEFASATVHPLPDDSAASFITDPPYYDAIPYSDLSDFFYVWLRRNLPLRLQSLFVETLTPKTDECILDEIKGKDKAYFEKTMAQAMGEGRRVLHPLGIGIVVFANKSTSGWESQLQAMIDAGWIVTGSWPIDTEMGTRLRAMDSAALASSVHLVCRPRENDDGTVTEFIGEWRDVLSELPIRIHEWMPRLTGEGVVGADAIFACLGPALEIFSRYSRVEKSNGETATLREYLEHVWAAVSTEALSLIFKDANAAGLEPDARLTAMWLWTIGGGGTNGKAKQATDNEDDSETSEDDEEESTSKAGKGKAAGGFLLEYDAARKIAQGLGANLEQCQSLVEVKGDKARLLPVAERTQYLFGKGEHAGNAGSGRKKKVTQKSLFGELDDAEAAESGWSALKGPSLGATVLDRVHQSMILFAANRGELLKRFLIEDGVGKDPRFWKLADNLNKLYPPGTDERRWVEGVLARKKGLGQ